MSLHSWIRGLLDMMTKVFAVDPLLNYKCLIARGDIETNPDIARFKKFIFDKYTKYGYRTFDFELDAYFDQASDYFMVVDKDDQILITTRVTYRIPGLLFPFEMAERENGTAYSLQNNENIVADCNSFAVTNLRAAELLFSSMRKSIYSNQVDIGYCLCDVENTRIQKMYKLAGFSISEEFKEPVHFKSYGKDTSTGFKPARWQIMQMNRTKLVELIQAEKNLFITWEQEETKTNQLHLV